MSSLEEEQTDTPEQEMLSEEILKSSVSNAPVWETFPMPTITNVFSMGPSQTAVGDKNTGVESMNLRRTATTIIKALNDGTVPKMIGYHKQMPADEVKKRLRTTIWNNCPPIVKYRPPAVRKCKSVHLNYLPYWFNAYFVKELIYLKTDFDPFSEQNLLVYMFKAPPGKEALLLFSNNNDCMKIFHGLQGLVFQKKEVTVKLDIGGKIAKERKCTYPQPRPNKTKRWNSPELSSPTKDMQSCTNVNGAAENTLDNSSGNSSQNDTHNETSKVQNNNSNEKNSTDKLATNGEETVPIKQEPADEVDISEPTEDEPSVIDLDSDETIKEELKDIDLDAMIEEHEIDTVDMIQTTNDAECNTESSEEEDYTECTVVHVKGLPVTQASGAYIIHLIKICDCFDKNENFFYLRLLKANDFRNINGEVLLKFTTHEDAVGVCNYLNNTVGLEAKLDIGNVISHSEEFIPVNADNQTEQPIMARFAEQWQIIDLRPRPKRVFDKLFNKNESYGLSIDWLKSLNIKFPLQNTVAVTDFNTKVTEAKLAEVFSMAGEIKKIYYAPVPNVGGTTFARIHYDHPVEAVQAISMFNGQKLYNSKMSVRMCPFRMNMPVGLDGIGQGLGENGTPLRDVRSNVLEKKVTNILAEKGLMKRFEPKNGPYFAGNTKPYNKTFGTHNQSSPQRANIDVTTKKGTAYQQKHQAGPINKPDAAFGTYGSQSKKMFTSNTPNATANSANIFSNPRQNSVDRTNPSNQFSNTQNNNVNPVIQTNKAPTAPIFVSQPTVVYPTVQSGTSNPTVNPYPNIQYPNTPIDQNPPPFANIPTNSGPNAVYQAVSNYMTYIAPTPNYPPPNMVPQNYVSNPAYIPNPAPMTMNYQGALPMSSDVTPNYGQVATNTPIMYPSLHTPLPAPPASKPEDPAYMPNPAPMTMNYQGALPMSSDGTPNYGQVATNTPIIYPSLHTPLPPLSAPSASEPPSKSETPNIAQKVTNINQLRTKISAASKRLKNILLSNQLTSKQNTKPQKSPQPSQSKYKTESAKKDEIPRKRDYEGKIKKGTSDTEDPKKLKPILYFRNLPDSVNTKALTMKMQEVGDLMFSLVTEKGRAIVCFKTMEDCERCLRLFNHSKVDGQIIEVTYHIKQD